MRGAKQKGAEMRKTRYATELTEPADIDGARIELIRINRTGDDEIRFS
jgi:hypothetical protein